MVNPSLERTFRGKPGHAPHLKVGAELFFCTIQVGEVSKSSLLAELKLRGVAFERTQAPPGAITVASLPISEQDDDPTGFYLRRIDGVLWLRSCAGHVWKADDEFVFQKLAA